MYYIIWGGLVLCAIVTFSLSFLDATKVYVG
jgi:hypothetical protein